MSWPHWLPTADVSANNRVVSIGPMRGKTEKRVKGDGCCKPGNPVGISRKIKEGFLLGLKVNSF